MDFGTIIIGVVILVICLLFAALIQRNSKKRKSHLLQSLQQLASSHKSTISRYEISGHTILGLDENANVLFFFKQGKQRESSRIVPLKEFKSCKLVKTNKSVPGQGTSYTMVDKLAIQFVAAGPGIQDVHLEFYNEAEDLSLSNELEFMEKWIGLLNDRFKTK